jgi:acetoin utilization protein AcuB
MKIGDMMTADPIFVYEYEPVYSVKRIMMERDIKHLPILNMDDIVAGIVSDRDIKLHQAVSDDPQFHKTASISGIYRNTPYCVAENTPAVEVLRHMDRKRLGSALITDKGELKGIFTKGDACRFLAMLLEE